MISLVTLPCGCVVDWQRDSGLSECRMALRCDWCGCVFTCNDLDAWFKGDNHGVWLQRTRPLFEHNETLYEVDGPCHQCAAPLVRMRGPQNEERRHLREMAQCRPLPN